MQCRSSLGSVAKSAMASLAAVMMLAAAVAPTSTRGQQQQQPPPPQQQVPPTQPAPPPAEAPTITARIEPGQISPNLPKTEVLCSGVRREQRPVLQCNLRFESAIEVTSARVVERGSNPPAEWTASFRATTAAEDDSAFLFLIDRTDTRRAATLRRIQQDFTEIINAKGAQQQVAVATYSASLDVLANFTRDQREAAQALTRVRAEGVASELFRLSIDAIARLESVQAGRKFLVLASDGRADDTVFQVNAVVDAAKKANVRIIAFGYAESEAGRPDLQRLRVLAQQTGGLFIEVPIRTKQIPADVRRNFTQRFNAGGVLEAEAPSPTLPGAVEVTIAHPNDRTLSFVAVLTDTRPEQRANPQQTQPTLMGTDPSAAFELSVDGIIAWLLDEPWRAVALATVLSILVGGLILALARRAARRKAARHKPAAPVAFPPLVAASAPPLPVPPPLDAAVPPPIASAGPPPLAPEPAQAVAPPSALEPTEIATPIAPAFDAVVATPVIMPEAMAAPPDISSDATELAGQRAQHDDVTEARQDGFQRPMAEPQAARPTIAVLEFADNLGAYPMRLHKISIGRHTDNDIRIEDVTVSRHHAIVSVSPSGGFEIHNLTANRTERNPVLVNGEERERSELADGDEVTIGSIRFRFRVGAPPA